MGILTDQMSLSNATVNARKISVEQARLSNLCLSQVRSGSNGNLLSGYWPGSTQGGDVPSRMYPDQNTSFGPVPFNEASGQEIIKSAFQHIVKTETSP